MGLDRGWRLRTDAVVVVAELSPVGLLCPGLVVLWRRADLVLRAVDKDRLAPKRISPEGAGARATNRPKRTMPRAPETVRIRRPGWRLDDRFAQSTSLSTATSGVPGRTPPEAGASSASSSSGAPQPPHSTDGFQADDHTDPLVIGCWCGYVRHPHAGQSRHRIRGGCAIDSTLKHRWRYGREWATFTVERLDGPENRNSSSPT